MKITSVSYGRTFNNGNYESSRIDITCDVLRGEDPEEIFEELIETVESFREEERGKK